MDRVTYLIVNRLDAAIGKQTIDLLTIEIWNSNTFDQTQINKFLHCGPCVQVVDVTKKLKKL